MIRGIAESAVVDLRAIADPGKRKTRMTGG